MNVQIQVKQTDFSASDVEATLAYALQREVEQVRLRWRHFAERCRYFESTHEMGSDVFMQRFEQGELGDDAEYFDWFAAKRGHDLWEERCQMMNGMGPWTSD